MATARVAPIRTEVTAQDGPSPTVFESFHWLPCRASVEVPIPGFTVGDLLKLSKGAVVQTASPLGKDVPIHINKILLGSGQFEVTEDRLAVRITEFA